MATQPEAVDMVAECDLGCSFPITLEPGVRLGSHTRCNAHGAIVFYRLARADERAAQHGD